MANVLCSTFVGFTILSLVLAKIELQNATLITSNKSAEEEFCQWLVARCPYIGSFRSRPVIEQTDTVKVYVEFMGKRILKISDLEQSITVQASLYVSWHLTPCAKWDDGKILENAPLSRVAKQVQFCMFPKESFWHPKLVISNAYSDADGIEKNVMNGITVKSKGKAYFDSGGLFKFLCELNFELFPFDSQYCYFEVMEPSHRDFVNFTEFAALTYEESTGLKFGSDNDLWQVGPLGYDATFYHDDDSNGVRFDFHLKRRHQFYVLLIFVPLSLLMFLLISVLVLPPSFADRAAFAATIFLAFAVSFPGITSEIPRTAHRVYLFYYILLQMALGAAITTYTLVTCELANWKFFNKTLIFYVFCYRISMKRIRWADLGLASISFVCVIICNAVYFNAVLSVPTIP